MGSKIYTIEFRPHALRDLMKLPRDVQKRIAPHINRLAQSPRPPGAEKLAGSENYCRIRVGDYRIVYEIHDDVLVVLVIRIGHRREVYKR